MYNSHNAAQQNLAKQSYKDIALIKILATKEYYQNDIAYIHSVEIWDVGNMCDRHSIHDGLHRVTSEVANRT